MCFIVLPQTPLRKLLGAAQRLQQLVDDGTIAAASGETAPAATYITISAFDVLADTARAVSCDMRAVSPFQRFRNEILAHSDSGRRLRDLVLELAAIFRDLDDYHTRIALDLITAFANSGEDDVQFKVLANKILIAQGVTE